MCNVNCTVHEIIKETWVTNSRYCVFDGFMKNVCWFKYIFSVKQVSLFKPIGILSTSEHNLTLLLHKEMYTTLVQTLSLLSHVLCPSNFSIFSFRSLSLSMVYYSFLCSTSSIFWLRHSFIYTFDFFHIFSTLVKYCFKYHGWCQQKLQFLCIPWRPITTISQNRINFSMKNKSNKNKENFFYLINS